MSDDYLERRGEFRALHLEKAWAASERGELVMGGALTNPTDSALLMFRGDPPEVVEDFARTDPPNGTLAFRSPPLDLPPPNPSPVTEFPDMSDITADQARSIVDAARARADQMGVLMNIAVVDAGANLKAFLRMDGAWLGSIDISIRKARTARFFDMPTGAIGGLSQPGGSLFGIEHSNGGLITFPGGIPLKDGDGTVIGAIGVSGSSVENDHAVAEAGVAALR